MEDGDGGSMASLRRLLRELQLQCRLSMSRVEGAAADLAADRRRLRCWCDLPYRERQIWRRNARRPQRGPRMTLVERPEPQAAINDVVVQVHASGFTWDELTWPSTWTDRLGRDRTPVI